MIFVNIIFEELSNKNDLNLNELVLFIIHICITLKTLNFKKKEDYSNSITSIMVNASNYFKNIKSSSKFNSSFSKLLYTLKVNKKNTNAKIQFFFNLSTIVILILKYTQN